MTNYLFCTYRASYQINQIHPFPFFFSNAKTHRRKVFFSNTEYTKETDLRSLLSFAKMFRLFRAFRVQNRIPLRSETRFYRQNYKNLSPLGGVGGGLCFFFCSFFANIRIFNYFCKVLAKDGNFVTRTYMRRVLHFHYLHNDGAT